MGKSPIRGTHQLTIPSSGVCWLCVLSCLAVGCRSPLTKDIASSGSTLSVYERPDSGYRPSDNGFKSTRMQPIFGSGKRPTSGKLAGSGNSSNLNDTNEEEYDVESDPNLKSWQKQLFRQQQIAVRNRAMNSDDVANPDRIRSERVSTSTTGPKTEGITMQFSDARGASDVVEAVEPEPEAVAVNKQDQPARKRSSPNKSSKEASATASPFANSDAKNSNDKVQSKSVEPKPEIVHKADATDDTVRESVKSDDSAVVNASAVSVFPSKPEEPTTPESIDWQVHARRAIAALETEQQKTQLTPELKQSLEGALRLMNLATGDLDNALKPIEKMPNDEQQYVRNTIQALHHAFDPEGNPLASRRFALVLESNRKAQTSAATVANLEVRNVAFCTEVDRYGMVTKFPQYQFQAKQECLLYCEVDNFVAVPVKGGFETELQGSYEIVDSSGRRVADELLPLDKDFCSNLRRDYFIPYRIYMPNDIQPGKYQLKLTIEDMKGRKFGQSIVDFRIGQ